MLKINIKVAGTDMYLPPLEAGDRGGSITDYRKRETEIIHFFHLKDGTTKILKSTAGLTIDYGILRETIPFEKMTKIKEFKSGESFEMPILTKFGEAILQFSSK